MRLDALPGAPLLTYCTNIHAGEAWPDVLANLRAHLPAIKAEVSPGAPMAVGLRLSGAAADALAGPAAFEGFAGFLQDAGAYVPTLNAFPYGRFHGGRVKEAAYRPDWRSDERLRFTNVAADLLAALLPEREAERGGSVSTVPGAFRPEAAEDSGAAAAIARNLLRHAAHLAALERRTGRRIRLAVEPEPACFLETTGEAVAFFEGHLFGRAAAAFLGGLAGVGPAEAEALARRHLGLCFDACHAAVEFEDLPASLATLERAGIAVPKLQVTAALRLPEAGPDAEALLRPFDDGVYFHQTVERRPDGRLRRFTDLPEAFEAIRAGVAGGPGAEWRVHCHVPVFLDPSGDALRTTRPELEAALDRCRRMEVSPHLEVETYTWDVLPEACRGEGKAAAIARELAWTLGRLRAEGPAP